MEPVVTPGERVLRERDSSSLAGWVLPVFLGDCVSSEVDGMDSSTVQPAS